MSNFKSFKSDPSSSFMVFQPVIESFFSRLPLIQLPEEQTEILASCLAIGLETLATSSPNLNALSQCSFPRFKQGINTWFLQWQVDHPPPMTKDLETLGKCFDDPFQVYPNWWGNADTKTLKAWKHFPKTFSEILSKWGITFSSNSSIPKPRSTASKVQFANQKDPIHPIRAISSVKKQKEATTQTFLPSPPSPIPKQTTPKAPPSINKVITVPIPPPPPAVSSKLPPCSPPKPFFVPFHSPSRRPTRPSKSKPSKPSTESATLSNPPSRSQTKKSVSMQFSPPRSSPKAMNSVKDLADLAQTLSKDPIFQQFQSHMYLDEQPMSSSNKNKKSIQDQEWFSPDWVSGFRSSLTDKVF